MAADGVAAFERHSHSSGAALNEVHYALLLPAQM